MTDLGAEGYVRLLGRISDDELVDVYRRAWVVASTSIAEGWGMTITEAAACGVPSVVSRVGGHCDSVVDGETGRLVDSSSELVDALHEILVDPELRKSLSDGARKRAADADWDTTAAAIFAELVEAQGPYRRPPLASPRRAVVVGDAVGTGENLGAIGDE